MDIQKVGVIGAGQMGNGIAHVLALAGYQVTITDLVGSGVAVGIGVGVAVGAGVSLETIKVFDKVSH